MDRTKTLAKKSNPFRSDLAWWIVAAIGAVALVLGIYILAASDSASRNIVFVIGAFLLVNGLGYALAGIRAQSGVDPKTPYHLLRAGIGIATGVIVVINRFADFMSLDAARVINGIGLLGMAIVTIAGIVVTRDEDGLQLGGVAGALVLGIWGVVILYQVSNDSSSNDFLGWTAVIVGLIYLAIAGIRWRKEATPVVATTRPGAFIVRGGVSLETSQNQQQP